MRLGCRIAESRIGGDHMAEHSYRVEVQPDFLERQCQAKPIQAVAELIWNGLDADATRVAVDLVRAGLE